MEYLMDWLTSVRWLVRRDFRSESGKGRISQMVKYFTLHSGVKR